MTKQKRLLLGRHGVCGQKPTGGSYDKLETGSATSIYKNTGVVLQTWVKENGIKHNVVFLRSYNDRTRYTGLAVIAGAFGMEPVPQEQTDLDNYDFSAVEKTEDPELIYPKVNLGASNKGDYTPNLAFMLANRTTTQHDGVEIDAYETSVLPRANRCLRRGLDSLMSGHKGLGVVVSSSPFVESMIFYLLERTKGYPITSLDEIGGKAFDMEEFAQLTVEETRGGLYKASLEVRDTKHGVDLGKL